MKYKINTRKTIRSNNEKKNFKAKAKRQWVNKMVFSCYVFKLTNGISHTTTLFSSKNWYKIHASLLSIFMLQLHQSSTRLFTAKTKYVIQNGLVTIPLRRTPEKYYTSHFIFYFVHLISIRLQSL